METWVFIAILALTGLLLVVVGVQQGDANLFFVVAGVTTAIFGSLVFVKRFRKWIEDF